jgi:hypothetical protein
MPLKTPPCARFSASTGPFRGFPALQLLLALAAIALIASYAHAGTLVGSIQTPSTGQPVANGTLSLKLSQSAILCGGGTLTTDAAYCWTDSQGNVVGLPGDRAVAAPVLSSNLGSGSLPAATYYLKYTWANATGEAQPSAERSLALGSSGTLILSPPASVPPQATLLNVYIGTSSGAETLQGNVSVANGVVSGNFSQSSPLIAGAAPPTTNTSICQVHFNDELLPFNTLYYVTLTNVSGSPIAGYPQRWGLLGGAQGTINLSSGTPLFNGLVIYPPPILANPPVNAQQSINGPLSLNGFKLNGVASVNLSGNAAKTGTAMNVGSGQSFKSRNHANSADLNMMFMDANDVLNLGDAAGVAFLGPISFTFCILSDTGFTREAAGILDLGNCSAGDKSGTLKLTTLTATGTVTGATVASTGNTTVGGHLSVTGGVTNTGTGLQHVRQAGCTTAAAGNAACNTTLNWPATWADTSYTVVCTLDGQGAGNDIRVMNFGSRTTTTTVVELVNGPTNANASTGTINCVGIHD